MKNSLIKKGLTSLLLMGALTGQAYATCQKDYLEKIDSPIIPRSIQIQSDAIGIIGYYAGTAIFGTAAAGIGGALILPLALTLGFWGAKEIRDNPYMDVLRFLNESEYKVNGYPVASTDFQKEIAVDGTTRQIRKQQKRHNRSVRAHNRTLKRFNKNLVKEKKKGGEAFADFLKEINEVATGVNAEQLAQAIKKSNDANEMCNGKIGLAHGPVIEFKEYINVDGATKKERKKQEKFNKKVSKHNTKMSKLQRENSLATKKEVTRFFQETL